MRVVTSFFLIGISLIGLAQKPSKKDKLVKINTSYGEMVVVLYDQTPFHKENFISWLSRENTIARFFIGSLKTS